MKAHKEICLNDLTNMEATLATLVSLGQKTCQNQLKDLFWLIACEVLIHYF